MIMQLTVKNLFADLPADAGAESFTLLIDNGVAKFWCIDGLNVLLAARYAKAL